jgi:gluconate kinase
MNPDLLQSQFDDLEEPESHEDVLTVQLGGTAEEIVGEISPKLRLASVH